MADNNSPDPDPAAKAGEETKKEEGQKEKPAEASTTTKTTEPKEEKPAEKPQKHPLKGGKSEGDRRLSCRRGSKLPVIIRRKGSITYPPGSGLRDVPEVEDKGGKDSKHTEDDSSKGEQGVKEEEGEGEEEEGKEGEASKRDKAPKEIPDDFYYDAEDLRSKPLKSEDLLPDDLMNLYHSFGYPCRVRNNLHALSTDRLILGAGCYLEVLHYDNAGTFQYEYYRTIGGGPIGAITVHPTGNYFAVGEKGSNPNINVYNADDFRLYRILRKGTTSSYTSLCFNDKGDLMASQGGEPDHMLTVWNWIQETVLLRCKAFSQEVNHVSFNRELDGALCTAGSGHIKFWHMARTFTGLKLQGQVGRFGRSPISDIEGYLEFPDGKVLSGSEWGNLLLWDEQLIKVQIGRKGGNPCHTGQVMHIMMVEGEIITAGTDGYVRSWNFEQIDVLEAGEESALVEVDPMSEVFIGPSVSVYFLTQTARMKAIKHEPTEGDKKSDSLHEDETTRHTWYCQDGNGGIWQADLSFRLAAVPPKRLLNFHSGAIVACAVSPITYLVMTLGEDGTLRLYDFLKKKLLAVKVFKAKGCSLVWIPVYVDRFCATVLAGFSDGAIRRVVIDGSTTTLFGVDRMECQLKLLAALRPHSAPVTGMAYSTQEKAPGFAATPGIHVCSLATCSEDKTIFFFHVVSADNYIPFCYVPLRYVPRHVVWSPDSGTRHHLLITCQDGIVIEMREPKAANTAETLEYRTVEMREMKFHSVKSQILHDAEVEKEREVEAERQKERAKQNKDRLDRGLETPSKQNLRIEAEDAAASEKKAKEEAENPWEAYIPPVPSPILQALYPEGESTFWLMLGDYDAGYFYECRFTRPFLMEGFEEFPAEPEYTQPVRAVPLECGDEEAITALCFNAEGNCVFMGMRNGHIRLLFLKTDYDLATQSMTWSQGFHDGTQGAIQSLCLSFDEAFLVSVGQDSNFFVFSLMPEDQLRDQIEVKQANVPAGDKVPDEPEADDISADDYTIEQFKQKSDYDEMVKQAEKRKQEKRVEIAALRSKFKLLQATNNELPPRHRLTPEEFVMERSLALELEEQKKKRLEQLHKQLAWDSEKAELGYRKLHDFYRKHVQSDFFCVRAIKTDHVIYSYRLDDRENRRGKIVKREATLRSEHGDADESAGEEEGDEAELTRLLGCSPHTAEDIMGASQRTMYLLKKVHAKRLKRARRKIAWRKFMETKPADDVADPADVEAIQWAQYTLGDRPLKADSSYKVPDSYRLTMADGAVRLQKCQNQLEKLQMSFNNKLLALREEKVQTLAEIQKCSTGLQEIQDRLAAVHYLVIPIPPTMGIDEQPGGQFQLTPDMEHQLKLEAQDKRRQHQQQEILSRQQETHISPFNKTHRKSSVAIAMERRLSNKSQEVISHEQSTMPHSAAAMPKSGWWTTRGEAGGADEMQLSSGMGDSDDTTLFHSSLREELKAVEQIKLKYMQSVLMKEIEEKTRIFDIHHRMLRHEKFEVDVLVKAGQIRVTTLQEEQLLLVDCEHVEEEIQSRIDNCLDQRSEMDRVLKQTQAQVSKLTKEIEESAKKEKTLFTQLDTIIGENNQFRDYLIKVFKKKVKRKVAKSSDDESDSSESDSDSSDDDDDSEDDDENAVYLDPNICPDNCSEEIYNQVISLRGERLDNDDQAAELKKNREALVKDIDSTTKKRQGMDGTLSKTENELHAFQLEKQKRVNDLDTVCTIQLHQIQCLRRREFKAITNELILSEHELIRLQNRISELKVEKKEEKMKSVERRKLHSRLEYERTLFLDKLAQMEETCKKEMVDKFGKIVDMAVVETVVADPQIEDVRVRLLRAQQDSDKELMTCVRKISDLKRTNDHSLKLDSEYKYVEADMKEKIMDMEKEINDSMGTAIKNCLPQDFSKLPKDVHALMDVVAKQSEILKGLRMEIDCLQGRLRPPPPPKK